MRCVEIPSVLRVGTFTGTPTAARSDVATDCAAGNHCNTHLPGSLEGSPRLAAICCRLPAQGLLPVRPGRRLRPAECGLRSLQQVTTDQGRAAQVALSSEEGHRIIQLRVAAAGVTAAPRPAGAAARVRRLRLRRGRGGGCGRQAAHQESLPSTCSLHPGGC